MSAANMVLGTKAGDNTAANSSLRAYEQAPSFVISHLMDCLDTRTNETAPANLSVLLSTGSAQFKCGTGSKH